MAFMESAFSPGWTNRIKMIMPETQMSVPIDEYIRNINWNALMPNINNGNRKERTNAYPLYPSRLDNMPPYPTNIGGGLRPNSLLNPNHIPIRHPPPPPMISRTNSFPIGGGGGGVQGQRSPHHHHHHGQQQIQQQQGQQNQNHQGNRSGNDKYKTSLCKSFVINGVCKYGTQCLFAHGEHEIRPCPPFNHQNQPQQNISTVTRALNHNAHPPHGINNNNVNGANHRNHNIPPPSTVHNNAGNNNGRGDLRSPPFHHHHQNVGSPPIRHPNMNNNQNANAHPPPNAHNNNNNNGGPAGRNNHPSGGGGHHHNKMSNNNKRPSPI